MIQSQRHQIKLIRAASAIEGSNHLSGIPGTNGNFSGRNGRIKPFWIFQSTGFILEASNFSKTSSFFGEGMGTSTCYIKNMSRNDYSRKLKSEK